ncbi:MAG TPA: acyl--CoA ligase [Hypericibacter adhaerens]|jgi:acyl-CoA synthetase (AMP-forming)/AMP-acid ligase II|uniref:AMP-dependent synthetase n=1 Tax=Hypericibacter adhaerens TaxID=2602016 RepID=A0A5J6N758_9PROT|nr:acyl--CoA ligase [Hypericibacter adhaerens]QEX22866.1 AMP-dependent synthetase [Hypericibacter adhaerens]HWA44038.1 acyl--CoA ligase [Hypericibacter adhaerens]
MASNTTVRTLIAEGDAGRAAIAAPGVATLSRGRLLQQIDATVAALRGLGIKPNDRVAIVLPNGPEMAVSFLAVASAATAAPLNPAYREEEFDFYLGDLEAKLLIVQAGVESPVRAVAERRGVPIVELTPVAGGPAGSFGLSRNGQPAPSAAASFAGPDDVALVLHTSGTTSRPKQVPLSHRNLVASAGHIRGALALTPQDRCVNIMPLFHIHGLIGALLSSLSAEASVFCTPGFNALKFFAWLDEAEATWYTAVPTMHQAILTRAERNREVIQRRKLRLIRSSSSSLPPPVMAELEATFGCPVLESYGMTEASHQMTSNPLPPRARKPGTVGIAAGPEVAILDGEGNKLPQGEEGEVCIRGPNVTLGYFANPAANASGFIRGWFRTGDQGRFDGEGYLTITGRLKEMINRGGEKIAPREVDEALLAHPAVAQAIAFALPHDKLGEEVAAAVVLREGQSAEEKELREFVSRRLADFKVPKRVLLLPEIPKGATGKPQRIGMAQRLGLA